MVLGERIDSFWEVESREHGRAGTESYPFTLERVTHNDEFTKINVVMYFQDSFDHKLINMAHNLGFLDNSFVISISDGLEA